MLTLTAEKPPFREHPGGAIRIGDSRIGLDLLVEEYESGMSAEEIVKAHDTLKLADVYAAIAYYLRHQNEVRSYLTVLEAEAQALRNQIESDHPPIPMEELLTRRNAGQTNNAPPGN